MKTLKIDFVIPQGVEDSELLKNYNKKEKKLIYEIGESYNEETVSTISEIANELDPRHIAKFNPILQILSELDNIKNLKEVGDPKLDSRTVIEANKKIGLFNSTNRKAKDELKRPYIDLNKKIQALYNTLDAESKAARESLKENFKEHFERVEEEKRIKEEKLKEEELKRIQELDALNKETEEKLKIQEAISEKRKIESTLKDIFSNAISYSEKLSFDSLVEFVDKTKRTDFDKYLSNKNFNHSIISDSDIKELSDLFQSQIDLTVKHLNEKIVRIEQEKELELERVKKEALEEQSKLNPPEPTANPPAKIIKYSNLFDKDTGLNVEAINEIDEKSLIEIGLGALEDILEEINNFNMILNAREPNKNEDKQIMSYLSDVAFRTDIIESNINFLKTYLNEN